ncbi:MAG TPA: LysR family transcriptional regulator [Amycolatopsis sp.]|nr:LysR family transcriptional regulator [Amycolatopsis sp.]
MLFRQLEYLVALSRERHFARAADRCHVSQPALSEGIRKLEQELDVPLVRRGRKFEGLTVEGERLVQWAQRILADVDALKDEVGAMRTGLSGELRIGCVPTASAAVATLVEPFCAEHPLVTVHLFADLRAEEILKRIQNFDIDAAITYLDDEVSRNFVTVPLYRERYVLLADLATTPSLPAEVTWAEAARLPLCLLSIGMQGRRVLDDVFAEVGTTIAPRLETDSVASLFAQVKMGRWAAIVPRVWLSVFGLPAGLRAVPLVEPARTMPVGLVIAARQPGSVMARALADTARRTEVVAALNRLATDSSV